MNRFVLIQRDPAFAATRSTEPYRLLIFELAGRWIDRAGVGPKSTQPELVAVARAHRVRQETCEAIRRLEQALARGGPLGEVIEAELNLLRSESPPGCVEDDKEARHRSEDS
jgi:hypothetical protein